jgi:signal peptidase II
MQEQGRGEPLTPDPPHRRRPAPRHYLVFFLIAIVGQNLDLWTKYEAERALTTVHNEERLPRAHERVAIPRLLGWEFTYNTGIIWGLGRDWPHVFTVVSALAVPLIVALFATLRETRWITVIALGLILAGTLGNLYDRLTIGAVRDFIKLLFVRELFSKDFPLFNLADSWICSGVALLILEMFLYDVVRRRPRAAPAPAHDAPAHG